MPPLPPGRIRRTIPAAAALLVLAAGLIGPPAGAGRHAGVLTACTLGDEAGEPAAVRIPDVQGVTRISPLDGEDVTNVPGVVTAKRSFGSAKGFWFQDEHGDGDPRASEGLFVFTGSSTPNVEPGDDVLVSGTVQEYYPGGDEESPYPPTTEITDAQWTVRSSGNSLPEAEVIEAGTLPDEQAPQREGSIEDAELAPQAYALDFWESREGMLVTLEDAHVVGPSTEHDELYVTTEPGQHPSPRGGTVYTGYGNDNTGVLKIKSLIPFAERPFPQADTGDTLSGITSGPVTYDPFGGYTLFATELGRLNSRGLARESTRDQHEHELAVANYNVDNLSGTAPQRTFDALARGVVENLASPDILALQEVQDNTGPNGEGDGVVAANVTLDRFTEAIENAGGPTYQWRQINPQEGADGGEPGGNIRIAFLYNPQRVAFVDRRGGDATTPVEIRSDAAKPRLSASPGRIDPADPAWENSRKPLVGEFEFDGSTVFLAANHFTSKQADEPRHGRSQPPERVSGQQRVAQAESVGGFVDEVLAVDGEANLLVTGDLNDFGFSATVGALTRDGTMRSLVNTLPRNERYTYNFEGTSQALDHTLISRAPRDVEFEVVHINAEFAEQASDHDPTITRFRPRTG